MTALQAALLSITFATIDFILLVWLLQKIKTLFVASTFSINRETELGGESISISGNTYMWDSQEAVFKRINFLAESAMERKAFLWNRFQQLQQEEIERKSALKEVK